MLQRGQVEHVKAERSLYTWERARMVIFTELGVLYARYHPEKLMDNPKLVSASDVITEEVKDMAEAIAEEWKPKLNTFDMVASYGNSLEAHAFLQLLATFANLCRSLGLENLIVIHRALREVDLTFHEELMNYGRSRNHMFNLSHFKDDSSPNAWDYSTWIRSYALFLEERLECCRVLKSDVEMDRPRTKDLNTAVLLEHLPALQQLLFRVLDC